MPATHLHHDALAALAAALGGSLHCAGMCGGLVLCASAGKCGRGLLGSQLLYHLGKTTSYLFLGSLAYLAGSWLSSVSPPAARALAVLAGAVLAAVGWRMLGLPPLGPRLPPAASFPWARLGKLASALEPPLRPLSLGMLSGWLPCPLVYAFAARAAASRSVPEALSIMGALGLGTLPLLLGVAASGSLLSPLLRRRLGRATGLLLVLLGLYTAWRALDAPPCCGPEGR